MPFLYHLRFLFSEFSPGWSRSLRISEKNNGIRHFCAARLGSMLNAKIYSCKGD